jgi:hypothetical protein
MQLHAVSDVACRSVNAIGAFADGLSKQGNSDDAALGASIATKNDAVGLKTQYNPESRLRAAGTAVTYLRGGGWRES